MKTDKPADAVEENQLSRLIIGLYALPALPIATLTLSLTIFIPNFYTTTIGLPLTLVGGTLFFLRLFDAVIDPILGYLCDKTDWRLGRRRGWFMLGVPLAALSGYMVFIPPDNATIWYLALWMTLLSIGISTVTLSFSAWGAELATGYQERSRVAAWREMAILIGTLVASAVPFVLQNLVTHEASDNDRLTLSTLAWFIVCVLPIAALLAVWRVPEPRNRSTKTLSLWAGLLALWQNKPFLRLITAFVFNSFANGFSVTLFLFYVADVLDAKDWQGGLLLVYFLCGMIGVPLSVYLSGRFGKHQTWCWAMILACCIFVFVPLLGRGDVFYFLIITVITGVILGADLVIPSSIQADVIDVDTAETGEQRSGIYFAAWSVATQMSLAATVGVAFPILDWAGFDASQSGALAADAPGLFTLAVLYGWMPVAMKWIAIFLMWSFPLDRAMHNDLTRRIEKAQEHQATNA